jgi:tRNA-splicing ligase RtcB (3'-phosphate/5'-hydroxy nucleic acid ligase)
MSISNKNIIPQSEATGILPVPDSSVKPITVIGTEAIRNSFDDRCLEQAINSRLAPGVTELVLNPDAHAGYGAPVGCVMSSPTHIYPGPVGVDIKCSMSLIQMNLPESELQSREARRAVINSLLQRLPTGAGKGSRSVKKSRYVEYSIGKQLAIHGAIPSVCARLGIPAHWAESCEDSFHVGHNETTDALAERYEQIERKAGVDFLHSKLQQLGSYGGGNHFGEANIVRVEPSERAIADSFGLQDGNVSFLSHCGSRGFGHFLAFHQFKTLQQKFAEWNVPFPGGDKELVYAPLGTEEANNYLDDMALGGNFATLNHLLINTLVLEAFQEVFPGVTGELVYFISHNIARLEIVDDVPTWVHRKGATRAFPAGHYTLKGTKYESTGHPILLPGNPAAGSAIMVATEGAAKSAYSVNHGAGRAMSRTRANKELRQQEVDSLLEKGDILSNCRNYPRDEAPQAYKDFHEVLDSVRKADLARNVALLSARFVIKDSDRSNGGVA